MLCCCGIWQSCQAFTTVDPQTGSQSGRLAFDSERTGWPLQLSGIGSPCACSWASHPHMHVQATVCSHTEPLQSWQHQMPPARRRCCCSASAGEVLAVDLRMCIKQTRVQAAIPHTHAAGARSSWPGQPGPSLRQAAHLKKQHRGQPQGMSPAAEALDALYTRAEWVF